MLIAGVGLVLYGVFYHPFASNAANLPGPSGGGSIVQNVNGTSTINPPPPNPPPNPPPSTNWHGLNGWCHGNGNKNGIQMKAARLSVTLPKCLN